MFAQFFAIGLNSVSSIGLFPTARVLGFEDLGYPELERFWSLPNGGGHAAGGEWLIIYGGGKLPPQRAKIAETE
jgi:hypothetical protein